MSLSEKALFALFISMMATVIKKTWNCMQCEFSVLQHKLNSWILFVVSIMSTVDGNT